MVTEARNKGPLFLKILVLKEHMLKNLRVSY
jgi:hypothetical protein